MTVTTSGPTAPATAPVDGVTVTVDGVELVVPKGTLVLRAAEPVGVAVPRFCAHPLLAPVAAGRLENSPWAFTSPGISLGARAACPMSSVRCKPTPSRGFSLASRTASAAAVSFTIRLAEVKMPSRCARITAWLTASDKPKSSAFTIKRRWVLAPDIQGVP